MTIATQNLAAPFIAAVPALGGDNRLYIGNAFLARARFTVFNPSTAEYVPWTPSSMTCKIVATESGTTPITGLGPFTMVNLAAPIGEAYYTIPSSAIAALDTVAYLNKFVYLVMQGGAANEVNVVVPLHVRKPRLIT